MLASLLAGNALVAGIVVADAEVRMNRLARANGDSISVQSTLGVALLVVAAIIALDRIDRHRAFSRPRDLRLLAAGIFPALVLGLHWRHMTATGGVAAMLVGSSIAALYLLGVHLWPVELFRISGGLSDAAPRARSSSPILTLCCKRPPIHRPRPRRPRSLKLHAAEIANWCGLKPAAIMLLAVPAGIVAGICRQLHHRNTGGEVSSM